MTCAALSDASRGGRDWGVAGDVNIHIRHIRGLPTDTELRRKLHVPEQHKDGRRVNGAVAIATRLDKTISTSSVATHHIEACKATCQCSEIAPWLLSNKIAKRKNYVWGFHHTLTGHSIQDLLASFTDVLAVSRFAGADVNANTMEPLLATPVALNPVDLFTDWLQTALTPTRGNLHRADGELVVINSSYRRRHDRLRRHVINTSFWLRPETRK